VVAIAPGGGLAQRTLLLTSQHPRGQLLTARISEQPDQPRPKVIGDGHHASSLPLPTASCTGASASEYMGGLLTPGSPARSQPLACPAVGAEWERRSAASCAQTPSGTVIVTVSIASDVEQRRQSAGLCA
jgi:hypothetical protein